MRLFNQQRYDADLIRALQIENEALHKRNAELERALARIEAITAPPRPRLLPAPPSPPKNWGVFSQDCLLTHCCTSAILYSTTEGTAARPLSRDPRRHRDSPKGNTNWQKAKRGQPPSSSGNGHYRRA